VDDGAWQPVAMDPATSSKYSWKLFTYTWNGATPGEHTIVSRVTDVNGKVQPTGGVGQQENVPGRQLSVSAESDDRLGNTERRLLDPERPRRSGGPLLPGGREGCQSH